MGLLSLGCAQRYRLDGQTHSSAAAPVRAPDRRANRSTAVAIACHHMHSFYSISRYKSCIPYTACTFGTDDLSVGAS
jgi:hypothetical protein